MFGDAKPETNDASPSMNPDGSRQDTMRAAQPDTSLNSQAGAQRGDRITPDRVISFLASLGALVTALVAMATLSEIRNQREIAWRPDVVPDSPVRLSLKVNVEPTFEVEAKSHGEYNDVSQRFPIKVYNFGYGPAKKLQFRWIYDMTEMIATLDELDQKNEFEAHVNSNALKMSLGSTSVIGGVSMPSQLIFLPEYDSMTQEYFFTLPPDFIFLLGVYAYLRNNNNEKSNADAFLYMRNGTLQVDYSDIDNTRYQQFYKIHPYSMKLEKVGDSVQMEIHFGFESTDAVR